MSYIILLLYDLNLLSYEFIFSLYVRIFRKNLGKVDFFTEAKCGNRNFDFDLLKNHISSSTYRKITKLASNLTFLSFIHVQENIERE